LFSSLFQSFFLSEIQSVTPGGMRGSTGEEGEEEEEEEEEKGREEEEDEEDEEEDEEEGREEETTSRVQRYGHRSLVEKGTDSAG